MAAGTGWARAKAVALALILAVCARGREPPRAGDEDQLLFEVRLEGVMLSDSFTALAEGEHTLLPLGELCRELDLAIQVDPAKGLAEGFLIEEKRRFRLDAKAATLTVAGVTTPLDRTQLQVREDDLYLDTRLLAKCLPLDIDVGRRTLVIALTGREPLPLVQRWKREGGAGRLRQDPGIKTFDPIPDPYRTFEVPAVDLTLTAAGGGGHPGTASGTVLAAGDLFGLSASGYALFQDPGGLQDWHLGLGRRDPHGGLLGPLRATDFGLGEVLSPGLSLLTGPLTGTGVTLGNRPLQTGGDYDRHSFQGDLAPGWQVELYRNQALVAFQASRADGRYEFLNIPLVFGLNEFRLAFYGPQGQRREETLRFDISTSQTPAGAFYYDVTGLRPHDGTRDRGQFQATYGLSERLTADLGVARAPLLDGTLHSYGRAGLQGFWKPMAGSLSAGWDDEGGSVTELALRTRLGPATLVGKDTEFHGGYQSEFYQLTNGPIRRRVDLDLTAALPSVQRPKVTLEFGGYQDQLLLGGTAETTHFRFSSSLGGLAVSNEIDRDAARPRDLPATTTTTGTFLASQSLPAFVLRSQAAYGLDGGRRLQELSFTAETTRLKDCTLQAGIDHTVATRDTAFNLGLVKGVGAYSLGANAICSRLSGVTATVTLRLGLARDPREGRLHPRAQGATSYGAVSARAFLDSNGNGRWDPGEKPLPDLGFKINGAAHPRSTDAAGVAFLDGLPQDVDANIAVAPATLDDPLMHPVRPGLRVTPRQGHVAQAEVPVILLGEINGTAYLRRNGQRAELPGLRLELQDGEGRVVKSLRTAYDGFFNFTELPPGPYRVVVPADAARRRGAAAPPPGNCVLKPEGTVVEGLEVVLEVPAEAAAGPVE